jgi:hypothetical protein
MKYGVNTMVSTTQVNDRHYPLFLRIREWGFDGVELFLSPSEPASIPWLGGSSMKSVLSAPHAASYHEKRI